MKIIFLDIDGVLNNCISVGIFHESSTIKNCINLLNQALQVTNSKIVIISSWKDVYNFEVIKKLLFDRGVLKDTIIGCTEKDIPKEKGIKEYLQNNNVENFVIVDDNLIFQNYLFNNFYVKTDSFCGLQTQNLKQITDVLLKK